jgi:hypothetical protein
LRRRLHRPARNHRQRRVMTDRTKPLLTCVMRSCKPIFPRDEGLLAWRQGRRSAVCIRIWPIYWWGVRRR